MAPFWHRLAVCKELGWHVFFGKREKTPMSAPEIRNAKLICGQCSVRRECLAFGVEEEWGMWGGYTRPERERALDAVFDQLRVPDNQRRSEVRVEQAKAVILRAYDTDRLDDLMLASSLP